MIWRALFKISLGYVTGYSPSEIITESCSRLKASGYRVVQKGDLVIAKGGRDYNKWVIVGCVILCLFSLLIGLAFLLIYYLTRTQNRITIDTSVKGRFTIMYEGRKATEDAKGLANVLRGGWAKRLLPKRCPNCGAQIIEGASYCAECGREIY
ncbi:MAG: zinc ribbon domain-containing protein [Candidatus Freyarchaeota archaeon]|nr:zinc ribbon domain-containing protein [Candidatus Jordarchaeia archaeon]MBS7268076.1 zinc ribbon domain-containing protein [Candidatus Jordarchaeia archaeon]MBS7279093.1 zinc ribbon domain-containing protein [Candidatus Jordarchaeia archaeon]